MKLALFWADGDEIPQALGVHTTVIGFLYLGSGLEQSPCSNTFFFDMIHDIWS